MKITTNHFQWIEVSMKSVCDQAIIMWLFNLYNSLTEDLICRNSTGVGKKSHGTSQRRLFQFFNDLHDWIRWKKILFYFIFSIKKVFFLSLASEAAKLWLSSAAAAAIEYSWKKFFLWIHGLTVFVLGGGGKIRKMTLSKRGWQI